jgi:chemotaxis protein MotA
MSANVFWLPLGSRLKRLSEAECEQMEIVIEGILSIQAGSNPRLIEQKLNSLIPRGELKAPAEKDVA